MAKTQQAEAFVDATAVFRLLGDEAAAYGITQESIRAQLTAGDGVATEDFLGSQGHYSKWITFGDGSCAAQVRGTRRWEMYR